MPPKGVTPSVRILSLESQVPRGGWLWVALGHRYAWREPFPNTKSRLQDLETERTLRMANRTRRLKAGVGLTSGALLALAVPASAAGAASTTNPLPGGLLQLSPSTLSELDG